MDHGWYGRDVVTIAKWVGWLLAAVVALWLLDRVLLWMESRGWIYWRRKQPSASSLGTAVLEVQSLLEPAKQHVVQVKREQRKEQAESGEPPEAG